MSTDPPTLAARLDDAIATVERLRREVASATCAEVGAHDWRFIGGKNAGCDVDGCGCSVPVHECRRCGDCDYGDNPEADRVLRECADG